MVIIYLQTTNCQVQSLFFVGGTDGVIVECCGGSGNVGGKGIYSVKDDNNDDDDHE